METNGIAAVGYALQTLAFTMLAVLVFARWGSGALARHVGLAAAVSALSGVVLALQSRGVVPLGALVVVAEWAKYGFWILAMLAVLRTLDSERLAERYARRIGLPVLVIAFASLTIYANLTFDALAVSLLVSGGILMAMALISLLEQIYRDLSADSTASLKYVCLALLVIAAYDIIVFLGAIVTGVLESEAWVARGYVTALAVLPLALAGRNAVLGPATEIRRQIAFYSLSLLIIGVCILVCLIADFYVSGYGGNWGNVTIIVLAAAAVLASASLLLSTTVRRHVRVFLTKVFFRYKYDYRKEWLRFIGTLSESGLERVPRTAVRAVAPIVNSPGGIVWIQENEGDDYLPVGAWHCELPVGRPIGRDSSLIRFMRERQWVIDLNEMKTHPNRYGDLQLDAWFTERDDAWLVVPLLSGKQLLGLLVLLKPRVVPTLNFEDHDLLRTVGRHVGTHIKQAESDRRLAESSQFGTYHRLSAFLMHDMNNLIAQQSLVVKNAEKYRHDPKFVDDTIETIAHSVARMRRLMEQLSRESKTPTSAEVRMRDVIKNALRRSEPRLPVPTLSFDSGDHYLKADPERLTVVMEHLIRNAQDATDPDGSIEITTIAENGIAVIAISDTGCGMSPEFITERLFRPFDSTKGNQSMGIGAYQAREYVRMLGGQLEVKSEVGRGTTFSVRLPVAE